MTCSYLSPLSNENESEHGQLSKYGQTMTSTLSNSRVQCFVP
jgi:hypothetical protein